MIEIILKTVGRTLFCRRYGPDTNPTYRVSKSKTIITLLLMKFAFILPWYAGMKYHIEGEKFIHNVFEKRTPILPESHQNLFDFYVDREKQRGYMVLTAGTEDHRYIVTKDLYPPNSNMYGALLKRAEEGNGLSLDQTYQLMANGLESKLNKGLILKEDYNKASNLLSNAYNLISKQKQIQR